MVALNEVCDLLGGFAFKGKDFGEYNSKVIKITDIMPPYVNTDNLCGVDLTKYNLLKIEKYLAHPGDFVLAMTGATIGKLGRILNKSAYVNQRVLLFRPKSIINKKFLFYVLSQDNFNKYIWNHLDSETAQPNISATSVGKYTFELPSIETQKKIAKVLSAFDDKIELNNKINENLEQQAQAVFNKNIINDKSINWKQDSLLGIANYLNGLAMQNFLPNDKKQSLPVLKIRELRQGFCDFNSDLCDNKINSDYIIENGDIIFSWSGTLLLDVWCGGKCGLNQHLFKISSNKYDKWFIFFWTKYYLNKFISIAADKATTMGHIKREDLEKSKVIIPPKEIYNKVSLLMEPIFKHIINNRIENNNLIQIRDTILPKLMNGEIDVDKIKI